MAGIDPSLYGGSPLPEQFKSDFPVAPATPTPGQDAVPVDKLLQANTISQQGAAVRAGANRERANVLESMGAAFTMTDTASILAWAQAPEFVPEEGYSNTPNFDQLPFQYSKEEFEFLSKSRSQQEWNWRRGRVEGTRDAGQALGDHPVLGGIALMLDPVYLGMDLAAARNVARLGRMGTAVAAGAGAGVAGLAAGQATPKSTGEIVAGILLNGIGSAVVAKEGKLVRADADLPVEELAGAAEAMKPKVRRVLVEPEVPAQLKDGVEVAPAKPAVYKWEPVQAVEAAPTPEAAVARAEQAQKSWSEKVGDFLRPTWLNMHSQMSSYGEVGKKVANLLYDNNADLGLTSVEAHKRVIRAELTTAQRVFEDTLKQTMAENGFGIRQRIFSPRRAAQFQEETLKQVQMEMFRREQLARQGLPIDSSHLAPHIRKMADALDSVAQHSLKELKAAGVDGAEQIVERAGWFHRQWSVTRIEAMTNKFMAAGFDAERAHQRVVRLVSTGLRRANGWDNELAYDVAASIINRAIRKGHFEDAPFNVHQGAGAAKQVRDILVEEGLSGQRLQRALDVLTGVNAEANKPGFLKRRMDLDYTSSAVVNGELVRVTDLIDPNLVTVTERYLDNVASQAAWARLGFKNANDIDALRTELLHSIPGTDQMAKAKDLFDNTTAYLSGAPAGEKMNDNFRMMAQWGRMVALANSALWQVTEYATPLARYGFLKTSKYAMKEMPLFRQLWEEAGADKLTSRRLVDVLERHSEQDMRLRPYLHRFEDNFEMPIPSAMQLSLQQAEQLVPYVNAMKFVHSHQARLVANLVVDRLEMAAKGDARAREMLAGYGIQSRVMDKLAAEIRLHGTDTAKWSDALWGEVRPAFSKMMDESVLHSRLGDMPAFAMFDKVGKFIFTYRSFMLAAHNKVLSGSLSRQGASGLGLLMMYQMPLSMLAVQAQSGLQGKGPLSLQDATNKAIGQAGGLGVFSELWGVVSGSKKQFGAPGLIPIDRMYSTAGDIAQGNFERGAHGLVQATPLLGAMLPVRALENLTKE